MAKKIMLSVPEAILNKLNAEKQMYSYSSVQQVIIDALREKYYMKAGAGAKPKAGRPRKLNEMRILTRKRIFAKKGGKPIRL